MPSQPEVLVGVGDASRRFGVSPQTIRNWEQAGIVPIGMRLGGPSGYRVWRAADLDAVTVPTTVRRPVMLSATDRQGSGLETA